METTWSVAPIVNSETHHQEEALKGSAEHALQWWTRTPGVVMMNVVGLLLLLSVLYCHKNGVSAEGTPESNSTRRVADATVSVDLSAAHGRVNQHFLSVTIDASLAADEMFMYLLGLVYCTAVTAASRAERFMSPLLFFNYFSLIPLPSSPVNVP